MMKDVLGVPIQIWMSEAPILTWHAPLYVVVPIDDDPNLEETLREGRPWMRVPGAIFSPDKPAVAQRECGR